MVVRSLAAKTPVTFAQLLEPVRSKKKTAAPEAPLPAAQFAKLSAAEREVLSGIAAGKIPAHLAIDAAVALTLAGKITPKELIQLIDPASIATFQLPVFEGEDKAEPLATGTGVSKGCASGVAVFDPAEAKARAQAGESVILVIRQLLPEQVDALKYVAGVISGEAEETAHASVIAREFGKPAVASWDFAGDAGEGEKTLGPVATIKAGQEVSINGRTGEVLPGLRKVTTYAERPSLKALMKWATAMQGIEVRANADSAPSIERALQFGATGVGLVRSEHMFFGDRLKWLQSAIIAREVFGASEAQKYFDKLMAFQQSDYEDIFKVTKGLPVSIRMMDPPLHEFLPKLDESPDYATTSAILASDLGMPEEKVRAGLTTSFDRWTKVDPERLYADVHQDPPELIEVAKELQLSPLTIRKQVMALRETNPMIGLRGVRLAIKAPEFYRMQADALFRAAASQKKAGNAVTPSILVPMVNSAEEIGFVKKLLEESKKKIEAETGVKLNYKLGAMIETAAGALNAHTIADQCEFFSFGTNDLTQSAYGLSRDDSAPIEGAYHQAGIAGGSPFESIDAQTVGKLLKIALYYARNSGSRERPEFSGGICGEQGADPATIGAASEWGVNYVSVSPYRVASAILASAQAKIASEEEDGPLTAGTMKR